MNEPTQHIAFDAKRAFCNLTGLGNYSRSVIENLMLFSSNIQMHLYTPKKKIEFMLNEPRATIHQGPKFFGGIWRSFNISNQLPKNTKVFHGLSNELPFTLDHHPCKKIVTIHDILYLLYPEMFPYIDRKIYHAKTTYAAKHADQVVAITHQVKKDLVEHLHIPESKISVVYQSCHESFKVPVEEFTLNRVREKYHLPQQFIFHLGRLEKRKNAVAIIKAMALAKVNLPLIIVGKDHGEKKQILELSKKLQVNTTIIDHADFLDLPALYRLACLFIFPSINEGFGIPILESLFCETPVITTNGAVFKEAAGKGALFVEPNNPEELGHAIHEALTNTEQTIRRTAIGKEYVSLKFAAKKIAQDMLDIYQL